MQRPLLPSLRDKLRRHRFELAAVFFLWHAGCVLATGVKPIRDFFAPINGWWVDGLRMGNTWGMFSKAPERSDTVVEAVFRDGRVELMSTAYQSQRGLADRIVDARLRKIQAKLDEPGDRATFGRPFLAYHCRLANEMYDDVSMVRLRIIEPEELDDEDKMVAPRAERIVMTQGCHTRPTHGGGGPRASTPVRRAP